MSEKLTRRQAKAEGFRSLLELKIARALDARKAKWDYEPKAKKLKYSKPASTYIPDFVLRSGLIIEVKGRFKSADRTKHLLIKEQHPDVDIRFVFDKDNTLSRVSKTRYSDWCDKHGFQYAFNEVPDEWIR